MVKANIKFKKILKRTSIAVAVFIFAAYSLNFALIEIAKPTNIQEGYRTSVAKEFGDLKIVPVTNLHSGGLGLFGWSQKSIGYVNFFEKESTIYIDAQLIDSFNQTSLLYKHEYAHVLQKEMVANASGGYPSIANPWTSAVYYFNTLRLNEDLKKMMPPTHDGISPFVSGLESAADCFAQPSSSIEEEPVLYVGSYLKNDYCAAEERRLAISLMDTETWIDPLTAEEKSKISPENIRTDVGEMESLTKIEEFSSEIMDGFKSLDGFIVKRIPQ